MFLPDDWPVRIPLDAWALVGSGKATSTSGVAGQWAQRPSDAPERPPNRYQIDIYRSGSDAQYVIAGTRTDPHQHTIRNIGRVATSHTNVVGAIRAVAGDLSVDAAVQSVLIQDVLSSLDPHPLT